MIDDLRRLNTLVGQRFDESMAAQAVVESKQLKVLAEKTKAMSEYAQALIDAVDEHGRTTSERDKVVATEREDNLKHKRLS